MKLGTATNSVVKKMISRSAILFRLSAARQPKPSPKKIARPTALPPSVAETPKDSIIVVVMSRPFFRDMPKSPRRALRM